MTFIPTPQDNSNVKQKLLPSVFTAATAISSAELIDITADGLVVPQGFPDSIGTVAADPISFTNLNANSDSLLDGPFVTNNSYYGFQNAAYLPKHNKFIQCRISSTTTMRVVVTDLETKMIASTTFSLPFTAQYDYIQGTSDYRKSLLAVNDDSAVWITCLYATTGTSYRLLQFFITLDDAGNVSVSIDEIYSYSTTIYHQTQILNDNHYCIASCYAGESVNVMIMNRSNGSIKLARASSGITSPESGQYWQFNAKNNVIIAISTASGNNTKVIKGGKYNPTTNAITWTTAATFTGGSMSYQYTEITSYQSFIPYEGKVILFYGSFSYDVDTGAVSSLNQTTTVLNSAINSTASILPLNNSKVLVDDGYGSCTVYSSSSETLMFYLRYNSSNQGLVTLFPHPDRDDIVIWCAGKLYGTESTTTTDNIYHSFNKCGKMHVSYNMAMSPAIDYAWPMPTTMVKMTETLNAGRITFSNRQGSIGALKTKQPGNYITTSVATIGSPKSNYELARVSDSILTMISANEAGTDVRLQAFYATESGGVTGGSETSSLKTADKHTHLSVCDNMAFYEQTDGGLQKIFGRPYTVNTSTYAITLGTEFTLSALGRVYAGRHGYQIAKFDATTNLFAYVNSLDLIPKIAKTNGTTTTGYSVNAITSNRIRIAQFTGNRFLVGTSTTTNSMTLYLTDGTQNIASIPAITGKIMYIIPWKSNKVVVVYSPSVATHSTGRYQKGNNSASVFASFRGITTDGDFGEGYICYSDNSFSSYNTSCYGRGTILLDNITSNPGTFATRIADNPYVAKAIAYQGGGNSNANTGYFAMYLNGAKNYETIFQVIDLDNDVLTLEESFTVKNFNAFDGGRINDESFWVRDVWGNYVEGGLKSVGRRMIGIAKQNAAQGESISVGLFGEKIDGGWSDLTVGESIYGTNNEEIGWAISTNEVLMLPKD